MPINPYHADYGDDVSSAPFAGRQAAFARLYQHLSAERKGALLFLGRPHIGKTALLRAVKSVFGDALLPVYIPLHDIELTDETDFFIALARSATTELTGRGYTLSRLNEIDPPDDDPRAWFTDIFLPPLLGAVRGSRRLLVMLDDLEVLIEAQPERLGADIFAFLLHIAQTTPLTFVATLSSLYEADIHALAPLISLNDVARLPVLAPDESRWLLQAPAAEHYAVPDACAATAHRATGGAPGLLQQFGYLMFRRWVNAPEHDTITPDDVKAMIPTVYTYGERDYYALWAALSADERRTLTAISAIAYQDPIRKIDASGVEGWLIETDYPLDLVAINSALRGLEYREAVQITPQGIKITADLLQMWLLEHARVGERARVGDRAASGESRSARRTGGRAQKPAASGAGSARLILLFALALLISTAILIVSLTSEPRTTPTDNPEPTVTLFQPP